MSDRVMSHMLVGIELWKNVPEIVEVVELIKQKRDDVSEKLKQNPSAWAGFVALFLNY